MKRVYFYGGTEENNYKISLLDTEENREIAKRDAWDGNIYFEDDGVEEISEPTWQDKIEAQVTYNSMMLGTLIEEV